MFTLNYRRPNVSQKIQHQDIILEKFSITSDFGLESMIWFPTELHTPLLEEEIASAEKSHDGPHMIDTRWTAFYKRDLDSASRLQWIELRFADN